MWLGCIGQMYSGCPFMSSSLIWCIGIKILLVAWIIFVPIVMTARLEKIIKLLEELNKK